MNVSARLSRPVLAPFALLPKDLPHRFQNLSDQAGRVLCVQSRGGVEEFFERINVLSEKAASPDPKKIREMLTTPINHETTPREPHNGYLILQGGLPEVDAFVQKHWK